MTLDMRDFYNFSMQEVLLLFILLHPVINEIMANPPGRESTSGDKNEYIEIYNPDTQAVSLQGYRLSDGDEIDSIIPFQDSSILQLYPGVIINSSVIPPGGYALVIDQEYLDTSDVPQPYNFPSGTVILTTQDQDIGNGLANDDPIYLISSTWDTIDTYGTPSNPMDSIPISPPDSFSVERINPFDGDNESNWGLCRRYFTPGERNSLTVFRDVGIISVDFGSLQVGEPAVVTGRAVNYGIFEVDTFFVEFNSFCSLRETVLTHLLRGDTAGFSFTTEPVTGSYIVGSMVVSISNDEDSSNDTMEFYIPVTAHPIVINEIMYDDTPEWIEIFNFTDQPVNLEGFVVKDASTRRSAPLPDFILPAGDYAVLTGDTAILRSRFPDARNLVQVENFPVLNNTSDDVVVFDGSGAIVDSLRYSSSWGGSKGRSLERVSPSLSSTVKENWGTCVDERGGTPGFKNSVAKFRSGGVLMEISHKVFNPDRENLLIRLSSRTSGERVYLYIFDLRGRIVRKLIDGERGVTLARWDGKNSSGMRVEEGMYIVFCRSGELQEKRVIVVK